MHQFGRGSEGDGSAVLVVTFPPSLSGTGDVSGESLDLVDSIRRYCKNMTRKLRYVEDIPDM